MIQKINLFLSKNCPSLYSDKSKKGMIKLLYIMSFLFVIFVSITEAFPYYNYGLLGHDARYHYMRLEALVHKIQTGDFFNGGIDYHFFNGAGYASSTGYPDIFLYFPALLRLAGLSLPMSMAFFFLLCTVLSYFTMYLLVKKVSGNTLLSAVGASLYVLSSYRLDNIYVRYAVGEILANVFWPVVLLGLYDFIFKEFKKPYILGIGLAGMLLSHPLSAGLALGVCVLLSLLYIKRLLKTPEKLSVLLITALCTLLVTSYFWIPLIEFLKSGDMGVFHSFYHAENQTIEPMTIFSDTAIKGPGTIFFLLCFPRLFISRNSKAYKIMQEDDNNTTEKPMLLSLADKFLIISLILCFLMTNLAPWKILRHILGFLQFPWRLYAIVAIMIIFSGSIYCYYFFRSFEKEKVGLTGVLIVAVVSSCAHMLSVETGRILLNDDHYFSGEHSFSCVSGEWMPAIARTENLFIMADKLMIDGEKEIEYNRNNGIMTFVLQDENSKYADIPYIWYKGYKAVDSEGKELPLEMNEYGMIRLDISNAAQGTVKVSYQLSKIRIIAYSITAVSVTGLLIIAFVRVIVLKKKKRTKQDFQ